MAELCRRPGRWGRDVTLLCLGQAVSQLGSRCYGVASLLWVLAQTGSVVTVGITSTVTVAAFAAAQLPGGWSIDRFDRRRVMLGADVASATAAASLTAIAATGRFPLGAVLAAMAVLGVAWAVRPSAELAVLPDLLGDGMQDAVGLLEARSYASGLVGPVLAGVTFTVAPWLPFLLDTASYLVAAATTLLVRALPRPARPETPASPLAEIGDGLRLFWRDRFVRVTALLAAAGAFAVGGTGLTVIVLLDGAREAPVTTALVLGAGSAAGLAGAFATPLLRRILPAPVLLVAGPATAAVAVGLLPFAPGPVLLAAAFAGVFLLQPAWDALVTTRWLLRVDDGQRGRVQSGAGLMAAIPMAATPTVAGALLATLGPAGTSAVLAAVLGAVAVAALAMGREAEGVGHDAITVVTAVPRPYPAGGSDAPTVRLRCGAPDAVTVVLLLPPPRGRGADAPTARLPVRPVARSLR